VAVETLAAGILTLDPTGSMLTSSHILLAKLAYNTNHVDLALPIIDKNIVFFPGMSNYADSTILADTSLSPSAYISRETGLTAQLKPASILEYDLLCGMSFCSRREWAKAHDAFERAVTFPTRDGGTSKIMVEAYKKWVLINLLWKGKQAELPSYTGTGASKQYSTLGKPYTNIANQFVSDNTSGLREEAENNGHIWLEDGNTGLVQEVLAAYQKWQILRLQRIYSKISIPEIRQLTSSAETGQALEKNEDVETLIQNMIISGMLRGVIEKNDDGTAFLTFLAPSSILSEHDFAKELAHTAHRLKQLQPVFKATNERLGTSKDYIKHLIRESKRDKTEDAAAGFQTTVDDEDLMGGVISTF
jgi:COP9 signalosome complex subunit 3